MTTRELLQCDLRQVARCFARFGVPCDAESIGEDLWQQWLRGAH